LNQADCEIGILGLGVMGRNLAAHLIDHAVTRVALFSYAASERAAFRVDTPAKTRSCANLEQFVQSLTTPRKVLLMITAGEPVDEVLGALTPLLSRGDIIIDGGNSYYLDTRRRDTALRQQGLKYMGLGISGGASGARHGASLMAGCDKATYDECQPLLAPLAARHEQRACVGWMGEDGAGHFVKMVHNGIEYGVMQLLAECYGYLREQMNNQDIAELFESWQTGALDSYLLQISSRILRTKDTETSQDLIEMIRDEAAQKGTGRWTIEGSLLLGVPVPGIYAAVIERSLSSHGSRRQALKTRYKMPQTQAALLAPADMESALLTAIILVYEQGINLLVGARAHWHWQLDLRSVVRTWQAGCIIRAELLETIAQSLAEEHQNLLQTPMIKTLVEEGHELLRQWVVEATQHHIPVPALSANLQYFNSLCVDRLPMNLIQGQRDYFGEHGFARVDKPGQFHGDWR
tara:strand:+ start:2287 stop:3675 length:1389 start_codon:yes stop_codon:yes gene_type:complete